MTPAARPVVEGDETNAAIEMLSHLDIAGGIITGDALHCNRGMARTINECGADYVLSIKGNQDSLLSDARSKIGSAKRPPAPDNRPDREAPGRRRRGGRSWPAPRVPRLKAIGMIGSMCTIDGKTQAFLHYFALSRRFKPTELLRTKGEHWGIESRLLAARRRAGEDMSRARKDNGQRTWRFCAASRSTLPAQTSKDHSRASCEKPPGTTPPCSGCTVKFDSPATRAWTI